MLADRNVVAVPIDGVGFQAHMPATPELTGMAANLQRFAELGLKLQLTELALSEINVDADAGNDADTKSKSRGKSQKRDAVAQARRA